MRRLRSILVAVKDPELLQSPAIAKSAQLARAFGASVELLHVIAMPIWPELLQASGKTAEQWQRDVQVNRQQQLEALAAPLRRQGVAVSCLAVWDHPPHEAIVRRAQATDAGLVVADRHDGSEPARWLMQYTDWELLRLCPVPVLLVGGESRYNKPVILAAVDPGHTHDKPGALDDQIVAEACLLAGALQGRTELVHALSPEMVLTVAALYPPAADVLSRSGTRKNARARLARLARRYRIAPAAIHVVENFPETAVLDALRRRKASLLVMGAVARSGLKRLLFGNTAERLITRVHCDLLVVKPPGFKTSVRARRRTAEFLPPPPLMS